MEIVANADKLGIMQSGAYLVPNLGKTKQFLGFLLITFSCTACVNMFAYKENDWKYVTSTTAGNPKTIYVDQNRIKHDGNKVEVWTKMVFQELEPIVFHGKEGTAVLMTKRMDSSVSYDCVRKTSTLKSYQLYDKDDKFIYNQWLNDPEVTYIEPGTADEEMYLFICVAERKETNGQAQY